MLESTINKPGKIDWGVFLAMLSLITLGSAAVISSVSALPLAKHIIAAHLAAVPVALVSFFVFWRFNYQIFQDQWKFVYIFLMIFLSGVLILGVAAKGSRSWYNLGFLHIQPSEFARVGIILVLANFLDKYGSRIENFSTVIGAVLVCVPMYILLLLQPDFSAIVVSFPVVLLMLYAAGAKIFHLVSFLIWAFLSGALPVLWTLLRIKPQLTDNVFAAWLASLAVSPLQWLIFSVAVVLAAAAAIKLFPKLFIRIPSFYIIAMTLVLLSGFYTGLFVQHHMKVHQQKRLEVFLSPESDSRGAGYNLLQARIAIGSGGISGKGFTSGTQSRLGFVPERHTDFILAVVGESTGFIGMFFVIIMYIFIMQRVLKTAKTARDNFGYLVNCGIFSLFLVYFFVNYGMMLGFFPVTGVPLPLVSYGGSNLVATAMALGIAESVYARRNIL